MTSASENLTFNKVIHF